MGSLEGFGGGDSDSPESWSPKYLLSAHGERVGSLVSRQFLPKVLELVERDSLLWVVRGNECVENLREAPMASAPADLVIRGDWMTPSALLHFSCDTLFTSEGVRD